MSAKKKGAKRNAKAKQATAPPRPLNMEIPTVAERVEKAMRLVVIAGEAIPGAADDCFLGPALKKTLVEVHEELYWLTMITEIQETPAPTDDQYSVTHPGAR